MNQEDFKIECLKLIKVFKLNKFDLEYIVKETGAKTYEDLFYEIDNMARKQQIKIIGV